MSPVMQQTTLFIKKTSNNSLKISAETRKKRGRGRIQRDENIPNEEVVRDQERPEANYEPGSSRSFLGLLLLLRGHGPPLEGWRARECRPAGTVVSGGESPVARERRPRRRWRRSTVERVRRAERQEGKRKGGSGAETIDSRFSLKKKNKLLI